MMRKRHTCSVNIEMYSRVSINVLFNTGIFYRSMIARKLLRKFIEIVRYKPLPETLRWSGIGKIHWPCQCFFITFIGPAVYIVCAGPKYIVSRRTNTNLSVFFSSKWAFPCHIERWFYLQNKVHSNGIRDKKNVPIWCFQ